MKIPYIKIPIADVSAYLAPYSFDIKGKIFQAVLNFGLYQKWDDLELPEHAQLGYTAVQEIVEKEIKSYKKFCKEQKQKIKNHWDKIKNTDDTNVLPQRKNQTETKQETETDINKQHNSALKSAGGLNSTQKQEKPKKLNSLQVFSNEVIKHFEPDVHTDGQKAVWFKRNCRCLSDILKFCENDIRLAIRTIDVCVRWLEERKLTGGYEAVLKRIPDYCATAKKEIEVENAKISG